MAHSTTIKGNDARSRYAGRTIQRVAATTPRELLESVMTYLLVCAFWGLVVAITLETALR